jgi:hypothetical protein
MGGHYYATSTLRDTCYGIIHSFAAGGLVTNSSHSDEAFLLLSRIVAFYEGELVPGEHSARVQMYREGAMDLDLGASNLQMAEIWVC